MARLLHVPLSLILCGTIPAGLKAGPIHDAAFFGKLDTIQTLLDGGADIDERDTFDRTAPVSYTHLTLPTIYSV